MKPDRSITHEFVEFIPNKLDEGKLYVSVEYATAAHNCFCGCGTKVVTPIHPTGWELTFDGDTVSLFPSIGNSSLPCRSHYWIRGDKAIWAGLMEQWEIEHGRHLSRATRDSYFGLGKGADRPPPQVIAPPRKERFWSRLFGSK